MELTPQTPIADLVRHTPAAIAVLQKYGVPFCCTGRTALSEACAHHGIAEERLIADIEEACAHPTSHLPPEALREELSRISALLHKLVNRHGERLPDVLPPLQSTFETFRERLLARGNSVDVKEAEDAMRRMRDLTDSYMPPEDACPTFRGVYYALSELERDMESRIRSEREA